MATTKTSIPQMSKTTSNAKNLTTTAVSQKVLRILIETAQNRTTITYEDLAKRLPGFPTAGSALGQALIAPLYDVLHWCKDRGVPPLTSLVVRKSGADQGIPGRGFWEAYTPNLPVTDTLKHALIQILHEEVYEYYAFGRTK